MNNNITKNSYEMRNAILNLIDDPKQLEKLYRDNKSTFRNEFNLIYNDIRDHKIADFWKERLNYETSELSWGTVNEFIFVIFASLLAGLIAKIPEIAGFDEEYFYQRNIGFIVFPLLTIFFGWKNNLSNGRIVIASVVTLCAVIFINLLPDNSLSDTLILSCMHLPLFLWAVLGSTFVGDNLKDLHKRIDFLKYNGDLVVISALIVISGGILTGITIGLFSLINFNIEEFYFKYIVIMGLSAVPIVGTYIIQTNPQLVNKVSPLIAKIFSPLVLVTLIIYLIAMIYSGKDPYNDREFLVIFNALLIGVMAIILFSVAGTSKTERTRAESVILFTLSVVTIIVNSIALSAILFRISEWGITPNRMAVLGGNILILGNLLRVSYRLFRSIKQADQIELVEKSIASYLPVYAIWTIIVIFIFPFVFGFR